MAWFCELRPCLADPPAESPSTRKSSEYAGFFSRQSASFPGSPPPTPVLRVRSRAFLAASRARAAVTIFSQMIFASLGFCSRKSSSSRPTMSSTAGRTSLETSLSFVWELNLGWGTFTESTQVRPSRMSSPSGSTFAFFANSCSAM